MNGIVSSVELRITFQILLLSLDFFFAFPSIFCFIFNACYYLLSKADLILFPFPITEKKLLQTKLRKASMGDKLPGVTKSPTNKKDISTSTEDLGIFYGNNSISRVFVKIACWLLYTCQGLCLMHMLSETLVMRWFVETKFINSNIYIYISRSIPCMFLQIKKNFY